MTAQAAAQWMAEQLEHAGVLYQSDAAGHLAKQWKNSVIERDDGGLSITKEILVEFRKLTDETVVWDRGEKC